MRAIILSLSILLSTQAWAVPDLPLPLPDEPPEHQDPPYPPTNPPAPPVPPPPPERPPAPAPIEEIPYSLGSGSTDRFGEKTYYFNPRYDLSNLKTIRIVGRRNKIRIESVRVYFLDIGEREITSLRGDLSPGSARVYKLQGRPVGRITVTASASYFWKKPGGFRVDVVALRQRALFDISE
ncbi:hypothetical protein D3C87_253710 [compost metagenome]